MMGKSWSKEDIKIISMGGGFGASGGGVGAAVVLISEVIPHQRATKTLNHASPSTFHVGLSAVPHLSIRCPLVN